MTLDGDPYLDRIKDIVLDALAGYSVTVYLFGSRARGTARRASDVDIAVEAHRPLPPGVLARLRDTLEESTVPYRVEILDLASAGDALRRRVKQEGVVWSASASA
jgi:predicted nucleotidyltransferase